MWAYPVPVMILWTQSKEPGHRYERRWYRTEDDLFGALRHFDKLRRAYRIAYEIIEADRIAWC